MGYFILDSEVRTEDGNYYSSASLNCIRASLFRFSIRLPLCLKVYIIHDKYFLNSNEILKAISKKYLEAGGPGKHFETVEESDLKKLRMYFNRSSTENCKKKYTSYWNIILACAGVNG